MNIKAWLSKVVKERTTLDGMTIVIICGSVILLGGLTKWLAWAGLAYGIYTLVKTES